MEQQPVSSFEHLFSSFSSDYDLSVSFLWFDPWSFCHHLTNICPSFCQFHVPIKYHIPHATEIATQGTTFTEKTFSASNEVSSILVTSFLHNESWMVCLKKLSVYLKATNCKKRLIAKILVFHANAMIKFFSDKGNINRSSKKLNLEWEFLFCGTMITT